MTDQSIGIFLTWLGRHAQLTRCFSAVAELLVNEIVACYSEPKFPGPARSMYAIAMHLRTSGAKCSFYSSASPF